MQKLRNLLPFGFLSALLLAGTLLLAQPEGPPPDATTGDPSVELEVDPNMSPDDMKAKTGEYLTQSEGHNKRVEQLKADAKKAKDILKLDCVNDKLLQVKALLNILDDNAAKLEVAISGNDDPGRFSSYKEVAKSGERIRILREEAEACIGEEVAYAPQSLAVDEPDVPDDPTAEDPFGGDVIEPPGYASPLF